MQSDDVWQTLTDVAVHVQADISVVVQSDCGGVYCLSLTQRYIMCIYKCIKNKFNFL